MRSLYSRVFLTTIIVVLASSLLGFLGANLYYHVKLKPYNDEKLIRVAEQLKQYLESHPDNPEEFLQESAALGYQLYWSDGRGNDRFYGRAFRVTDLPDNAIRSVLNGNRYHGVADFPDKPFVTGFFDNRLSNTVGVPVFLGSRPYALFLRPDVLLQFGELRLFFALIGLFTVVISVLFFLLSTRYLVKPITGLSEATKLIAQGNYKLRLPVKRRDEIGRLARHFLTMSEELERVDQARQQFVSNVSHEIQSPLTSIQGFAKVLAEKGLPEEERRHYAAVIEEESRHLSQLSKQLLLLSSLEQGEEAVSVVSFRLRDQIRQAVQVLQWQLDEKELLLKLSIPESLLLKGDEVLLMQVWMNLLSNAVTYTPQGGSIEIVAEQGTSHTAVEVRNTGQGIEPEHWPYLFDRFYRADRSRDRSTGRTGLGLAIVKKIVRLHGGTVGVASSEAGTVFTVTLPNP